jgi:hypothetical protein
MQDVHQEHDALIPVIGNKNGFNACKATVGDQDPIATLEVWHSRFSARDLLANPLDDFVLDGEGVLVDVHDLDNPTRRTDGIPVVVDLIELDEKISGEERLLYRNLPILPELLDEECRTIARKPLSLQVLKRATVLASFALDNIPTRPGCGLRHGL